MDDRRLDRRLPARRRIYDRVLRGIIWGCAALCILLVVSLIGYILIRGLPHVTLQLLTSQESYLNDTIGILPNILNTLYIIIAALVIVLPLGSARRSTSTSTPRAARWCGSSSSPPRPSPASPRSSTALWG